MANIGQRGSMEAIQILKSEEHGAQHVLHLVDVYQDGGPTLQEVLCTHVDKDLPIFVFSVTGRTRGGKSFLLNLMIKFLENVGRAGWMIGKVPSVFDWEGGKDSITKGIWICPKIFKMRNESGREVGILLLDNQGLFDGEQTDGVAIAMSGISTAISHIQMFNLKEKITTHDLESIWRHLVSDSGCNPVVDAEASTCTLMFVVRDYLEEDEGCGLKSGQMYLEDEKKRGTQENKLMWSSLLQNFHEMKCLLLPHPGLAVTKKCFRQKEDLSVLEKSFMKEVDLFFREVFAPASLNLTNTNHLTGSEIYDMLRMVNGKVANEDLSFFNVFTEHGNEDKFNKILQTFESRLDCYRDNLSAAHGIMEDVLKTAKNRFKGKTADEFLSRLQNIMVEKINALVKEIILEQYRNCIVNGWSVKEKHKQEYPIVKQQLRTLVGTQEQKSSAESFIVLRAASIYYENLRYELERNFESKCSTRSLAELYGYDDIFVSNQFQECPDFREKRHKAVWLNEKLYLKEHVQHVLLKRIATVTELDISWLQNARKQQYEYFEAFTWGNNDYHWNKIYKHDEECLKEMVAYGMFKKPLTKLEEDQLKVMQPVVHKIKCKSSYDPICLSCIFVIYLHNNNEIVTPVFKVQSSKGVVFIDTGSRAYSSWSDYEENNKLPECVCCSPLQGEYNKKTGFQVVFAESPAAAVAKKVFGVLDIFGKVVSVGAVAVLGAAAAIPALPVVTVIGGTVAAVTAGGYGLARGVSTIVDKVSHSESVSAGDVLNVAGNSLGILTAGASTVAAALMNTTREVLIAQSVVQGLSSITLALSGDEYYDVPSLLNEMVDISIRVLFYLNSKTPEEAIDTIRNSYGLGSDASKQNVLKALVAARVIGSSVDVDEKNPEIREFVSTGVKSFVLDLCKLANRETTSLMTSFPRSSDKKQICDKMEELYCNLKLENANLGHLIKKFLSDSSTDGDLELLRRAIEDASQNLKTNYFLLFRNLIFSVSAKIDKANRLFESAKHEGYHLKSYYGIEFHPVKEVYDQIEFAGLSRNDANNVNCLDKQTNENVSTLIKKFLVHLCDIADVSWNLQDFVKCLADHWSKISLTFDDDFKNLQEQIKEFEHQGCDEVSNFMLKNGSQKDLGSHLLEKVLQKTKNVFTANCTKNRNGSNAVMVPAWEGLVDHLYCYCISKCSQNMSALQLVEGLLKQPLLDYNEQQYNNSKMSILKSKSGCNPSYYVYRDSIDNQECGLIYCDK